MAYKKSTGRVANKLKGLIKDRIKQLGLIDTGQLYDSIMVYPDGDTYNYSIKGEYYLKYLDGDFDIIEYCINSREFQDYIKESVAQDYVEYEIEEFKKMNLNK